MYCDFTPDDDRFVDDSTAAEYEHQYLFHKKLKCTQNEKKRRPVKTIWYPLKMRP